jgi:CRISPR-associated endonuclease Cas2
MALFMISYDLRKDKDYQKLWDALKKNGAHKILLSQWLLETDSSVAEILKWLRTMTDEDDQLVVVEFEKTNIATYRPYQGTTNWLAAA